MCGAVQHKQVWAAARAAACRGCGLLPPAPQLLGGEPALGGNCARARAPAAGVAAAYCFGGPAARMSWHRPAPLLMSALLKPDGPAPALEAQHLPSGHGPARLVLSHEAHEAGPVALVVLHSGRGRGKNWSEHWCTTWPAEPAPVASSRG